MTGRCDRCGHRSVSDVDTRRAYFSREIPLARDDMAVMYTDGLAEARNGDELFGEERIGDMVRRNPGVAPGVLCNSYWTPLTILVPAWCRAIWPSLGPRKA
ncbi:MAG: hypothetical protein CM1200mP26_30290 [Acidimicrobiales bacterium]|nr:MAG: hypothetical protein CM1200mP26_30290 [Acidimicrobiales bacterium]